MTLPPPKDTQPNEPKTVCLELAEMYLATSFGALWSFVRCKSNKRWIWLALCKHTRQVVVCVVGGRGVATCRYLWQAIPEVSKQGSCFTDFGTLTKPSSLMNTTRLLAKTLSHRSHRAVLQHYQAAACAVCP